jgi:hypothetical protein
MPKKKNSRSKKKNSRSKNKNAKDNANKNILSTKVDRQQIKGKISNDKPKQKHVIANLDRGNENEASNSEDKTGMDEILDNFDDSDDDILGDNSFDDYDSEDITGSEIDTKAKSKKSKSKAKIDNNDNDKKQSNKKSKSKSNNDKKEKIEKNLKDNNDKNLKAKIQKDEIKMDDNINANDMKMDEKNKVVELQINSKANKKDEFPILDKYDTLPKQKNIKKNDPNSSEKKLENRIIRAENIYAISRWETRPNDYPSVKFEKLVRMKDKDFAMECFNEQKIAVKEYLALNKDDDITIEFTGNMKPKSKKFKKSGDTLGDILKNPKMAMDLGDQLYCYSDKTSRRLFLDKPLVADKNVQLYILKRENLESKEKDENHKLIVKNYINQSGERDIRYEIGAYHAIRSMVLESGYERYMKLLTESYKETYNKDLTEDVMKEIELVAKNRAQKLVYRVLPFFSSSYMMYGTPVLILELLEKLDESDDPYNIGFEVIHHLSYIHQIGVHNDIKPENIMKITRMSEGKKRIFYYLIDFGGLTNEKFPGGGYRRFVWSPKWTCQIKPNWYKEAGMGSKESEKVRKTSPRYDFIELGVTMRVFQITSKLPTVPSDIDENYLHDFTRYKGRLKKYMEYVLSLPSAESYPIEVYREMQDILCPISN